MNQGLLRGPGRTPPAAARATGTVIARARSTATASTGTTGLANGVDVTGLTITFTVLAGEEVEVEGRMSFVYSSAIAIVPAVTILDDANVQKAEEWAYSSSTSDARPIGLTELISTPGTYTRKLRLYKAAGGAGNAQCGAGALYIHQLKATVQ